MEHSDYLSILVIFRKPILLFSSFGAIPCAAQGLFLALSDHASIPSTK